MTEEDASDDEDEGMEGRKCRWRKRETFVRHGNKPSSLNS